MLKKVDQLLNADGIYSICIFYLFRLIADEEYIHYVHL